MSPLFSASACGLRLTYRTYTVVDELFDWIARLLGECSLLMESPRDTELATPGNALIVLVGLSSSHVNRIAYVEEISSIMKNIDALVRALH